MPLTRESNLQWRAKNPGAILLTLKYAEREQLFSNLFISKEAFYHLKKGLPGSHIFWRARASTLASHLEDLLTVTNRQ